MPALSTYQSDLLQKKFDRLVDMTAKMRYHQKQYELYRASSDRDKARRYASEVDKMLSDEYQAKQSKQKEIF